MSSNPSRNAAFLSTPRQAGGEPRWFLDYLVIFKASGHSTEGGFAILEHFGPHGAATPLHMHHKDDEWFYVIEGELTVWVGGQTTRAGGGTYVFCPRGKPHTSIVSSSEGSRFLVGFTPAVADGFVYQLSSPATALTLPPSDRPTFDADTLSAACAKYGIEILGPPGIPA